VRNWEEVGQTAGSERNSCIECEGQIVESVSILGEGGEDLDPSKAEQYARWRELRKLQEENEKKSVGPGN